jgi:hypothetical protein
MLRVLKDLQEMQPVKPTDIAYLRDLVDVDVARKIILKSISKQYSLGGMFTPG